MEKQKIYYILKALRVNQWIKNLIIFTAIIFSGKLFDLQAFVQIVFAFFIFCLLSSTSYVLNDLIDYDLDRKHPIKKNRPIASGQVTTQEATFIVFILSIISLLLSLLFSLNFFFLSLVFILLHFFYSLYLKKYPVIDIFSISFSFMLRAFAGEVASGYHISIWLLLTIFFISLFMATVKRHAELVLHGIATRTSLFRYKEHLLNFLTNTFATTTIIAYASYTYFEKPPAIDTIFSSTFSEIFPSFEARKWMMVTIPFVVYGIARYAQLLYEREQGERPEKLITQDRNLVVTIFVWGLMIVTLIYIL